MGHLLGKEVEAGGILKLKEEIRYKMAAFNTTLPKGRSHFNRSLSHIFALSLQVNFLLNYYFLDTVLFCKLCKLLWPEQKKKDILEGRGQFTAEI